MIKRIIFLRKTLFNLRDYQRLGIEVLQKNGFRVEVWDLTPVLYPNFFKSYTPSDLFDYKGRVLINDRAEMVKRLSNLSQNDFVINLINFSFENLIVYRALSRSRADYAVYYLNAYPHLIIKKAWLNLLIEKLKRLASFRYPKVWKDLFMKLPPKWLGVKLPRIIFTGPNVDFSKRNLFGKDTEVLEIHALDYDLYLAERDKPYTEKGIAVFLDKFSPFHPDYIILGGGFPIDTDRYYKLLNDFFTLVEEKTGLEVVIAAHPRSDYEKRPDYFNGRKCIRGNTVKLVKESKLVLAHASGAVNFAALFYKPMIFMTCGDISNSWEDYKTRATSTYFGKRPIIIDQVNHIDFDKELEVDKEYYDNYRRIFIKGDGTEDLPFWQVVANRLKRE